MSHLPPLPPHLDPRGRHRGPNGSGGSHAAAFGVGLRVVLAVFTVISIGLLVVAGYYWNTYRTISKNVKHLPIAVGAKPSASGGTAAAEDFDGKDMNILLVGNDDRSNMSNSEVRTLKVGRDGGSLATDTMMIVHVPADGSRATLISLPRDTYVDVPGYGRNLLNSPYALAYTNAKDAGKSTDQARLAGANLLVETVTNLTGLTINHYVQIDLLGFYRISNAIGGVPVNLCQDVSDPVISGVGGSGLKLSKGFHKIKGVTALEFVRQRHNLPGGDLDRVRRQQYFLTAAFRQVASVGILTKLKDIGDAVTSSLYTDDSFDLLDIAKQLEHLTANNIVGRTIPTTPDGAHLAADPAKVQKFIRKLFAKQSASSSTPPVTTTGGAGSPAPSTSSTTPAIDAKCIN